MSSDSVEERVKSVVQHVLKIPADRLTASARFRADLGATSVQSVELMAGFEEEFDLTLDEDEALAVQTLGEAVAYLSRRLREAGRNP